MAEIVAMMVTVTLSNQQFKIKDAIYYTTTSNVHSNRSDKEVCNGLGKIKTTKEPPLHNRSSTVELKQKVRRKRYKLAVGIDEGRLKMSNQMVENWKIKREENLLENVTKFIFNLSLSENR
ncbi:hypothetical protein LIER_39460 [Lithospermum erythrorhizon]|uniref:Uncharacterized protein n=1 Tax=Lithospermum erythrorhizon TaxID=34254 RepID=A0AAV3QF34_LITER